MAKGRRELCKQETVSKQKQIVMEEQEAGLQRQKLEWEQS